MCGGGETSTSDKTFTKFIEGDPALRIDLEDPLKERIELIRDGENGL